MAGAPVIGPLFGGVADLTSGLSAGAAAAAANEKAKQERLRSVGNTLAAQDNLAGIDFSGLDSPAVADNLTARRDTLLAQRQAPGRAQTLLASKVRAY